MIILCGVVGDVVGPDPSVVITENKFGLEPISMYVATVQRAGPNHNLLHLEHLQLIDFINKTFQMKIFGTDAADIADIATLEQWFGS